MQLYIQFYGDLSQMKARVEQFRQKCREDSFNQSVWRGVGTRTVGVLKELEGVSLSSCKSQRLQFHLVNKSYFSQRGRKTKENRKDITVVVN